MYTQYKNFQTKNLFKNNRLLKTTFKILQYKLLHNYTVLQNKTVKKLVIK